MADTIELQYRLQEDNEDEDGQPDLANPKAFNHFFELSIPEEIAPSQSSKRTFRVFHQLPAAPGKGTKEPNKLRTVAMGVGPTKVSSPGKPPPEADEDPLLKKWIVIAPATAFVGELIFQGEWVVKSDGHTERFEKRVPAGTDLNKDQVEILLETAVPVIGRRVNEVAPELVSLSATDEAGKAIEVLEHVDRLLEMGLAPVWASFAGLPTKDGQPMMAADPDKLTEEELEEAWAQLLSEWLVGTPYAGPGVNHFGTDKEDKELFGRVLDEEPVYPITYACQHLCTVAAVSRGFEPAARLPIDARSAQNVKQWGDGAVVDNDGSNRNAATALRNGVLKPATSFVASDIVHVAFILRSFKAGRLQMIDTGAMTTDPASPTPFGRAGVVDEANALTVGGLNFDTGLATSITRKIKHIGVPPPADLKPAVERMKKARPLGVARLLLLDRVSDAEARNRSLESRLRFASPLIPMWFKERNHSILRLFWSLRSHPHAETFEARWWVGFPQHEVARGMLESRAFDWAKLEEGAKKRKVGARQLIHPAVYIGSLPNGQVRFVGRFSTKIDKDGKTFSSWFDSVQNKAFQPPDSNAVLPTIKERSLPLDETTGTAGGATPKGFDRLLSLPADQVPEYLRSVVGG